MSTADNQAWMLGEAAASEAEAVIQALSSLEPDLAAMSKAEEAPPVQSFTPDHATAAWRKLYLSLFRLPHRILLVGSIDDLPGLAGIEEDTGDLLVVETDTPIVSTAEFLPRGTEWRSLAEFADDLNLEDRFKVITALINSLQPSALLVMGSRTGWEMLSRHGHAIRSNTALFAAVMASPESTATNLLGTYLRVCIPVLSLLYGPDERTLRRVADLFGLDPDERGKLKALRDWRDPQGFLAPAALLP